MNTTDETKEMLAYLTEYLPVDTRRIAKQGLSEEIMVDTIGLRMRRHFGDFFYESEELEGLACYENPGQVDWWYIAYQVCEELEEQGQTHEQDEDED